MKLKKMPWKEALKQIHRIQKYPTDGFYAQVSLNLETEDLLVDEVGNNSWYEYNQPEKIISVWTFAKNDRVNKDILTAFVKLAIDNFNDELNQDQYHKREEQCTDMLAWPM